MIATEIVLSKLKKQDVIVLKEATEALYKSLLLKENQDETNLVFLSILQSNFRKFFDAHAKAYKQENFRFKVMHHEAVLIVNALSFFNENTMDQYNKNIALGLILRLDPKTK